MTERETAAPVNVAQETDSGPRSTAALQADRQTKAEPEAVAGEGQEVEDEVADGDEQVTPENPEPRKRKSGVQKRLDELTAEKYGLAEAARKEKERADTLEARLKAQESAPKTPPVSEPAEKTLEDFDFDPVAFQKYLVREEARKIREEEKNEERKQAESKAQQDRLAKFQTKQAAVTTEKPDFEEVALKNPLVQFHPQDMQEFIMDSDVGPDILYHLGKHPAEADVIIRMTSQVERTKALARIEARLDVSPGAVLQPKTFTQAPAPVKSLQGTAPVKKSLSEMSMDEYAAERKRQTAAKRR